MAWLPQSISRNTALHKNRIFQALDLTRAPAPKRNHPTEKHFLPLLVAAGATNWDEAAIRIPGGMNYGVSVMESYAWGLEVDSQESGEDIA